MRNYRIVITTPRLPWQAARYLGLILLLILAGCARQQPMSDPATRATLIAFAPTVTPKPWEPARSPVPTKLPTPALPTVTPYATPKPQSDFYESVELGLRFEHPFHWSRSAGAVPGAVMQLANQPNNVFLLIVRTPFTLDTGLEEAGTAMHERIAVWLSGMETVVGEARTVGDGIPAWYSAHTITFDDYGVTFNALAYSVANGRQLITLAVYAREEDLRAEQPTLDQIFASVKLTEPTVFGLPRSETYVYAEPEAIDARVYDPAFGQGDRRVFNGLVSLDPQLRLQPELAESWDISADGTVYTFYLRPDARFHDGRPVTAQDFVYAWERAADPATESPIVLTYLGDIAGVAARHRGSAETITGLQALDERTLQVTLEGPRPYFMLKLTSSPAVVLDRANVESGPSWYRNPNGTGPYRLLGWQQGKVKLYERSPFYIGEAPQVRYLAARLDVSYGGLYEYQFGELDRLTLNTFTASLVDDPASTLRPDMREVVPLCTSFVAFDITRPPFDDPLVRQAFALAIDHQRFAERSGRGASLSAQGLYPPGLPGYNPDVQGLPYDPELARRHLAESAYAGGALPPITLTNSGYGFYIPPGIGVLVQMWQEQLGARIAIAQIAPEGLASTAQERGNLFFDEWCADYPDPENFADALFHSQAQQNLGGYSNPALDVLLEQARSESDITRRLQLYQEAEALLVADGAAIFLDHRVDTMLVAPRISGAVGALKNVPVERYLQIEAQP